MRLLLGYGNSLRTDDGVGPLVARRVAARGAADLAIITAHQLLPEHAEAIGAARRVVFVDATAAGAPGEVQTRELTPDAQADAGRLHQFSPQTLLAYARLLYGQAPPAALVTVCGYSFAHGEGLSPQLSARLAAVETAVLAALEG